MKRRSNTVVIRVKLDPPSNLLELSELNNRFGEIEERVRLLSEEVDALHAVYDSVQKERASSPPKRTRKASTGAGATNSSEG